jgi:hypothetical protein
MTIDELDKLYGIKEQERKETVTKNSGKKRKGLR